MRVELSGVTLRLATLDDVLILVAMNRRLIEAEGSRNAMTLRQLANRIRMRR